MTIALVTGATAGLGRGFAEALAAEGHDLVLVARTEQRLEQVAAELRAAHGTAVTVLPADLGDPEQRAEVERRVVADRVDVLVNNAGFGIRHGFVKADVAAEQQLIDVLITTPMRLCHAAVPAMIERGSGTIVNISSVAGWAPGSSYAAAKAWVTTFTEGLAGELAGTGVTATAVCPGFVHTEFHDRARMNMSGVPRWMWLDADQVVREGLADARKGHVISVPGRQYQALSLLAQYAPRPLVRKVMAPGRRPGRRKSGA